jgi:WD40 repeat protein
MSPSASIDYRSALQVAPERIARLKDAELGELMGQLLRAQSHRCGAPLSEVRTNTEEKAADDGADATSGKPETPDEWLGDAETCWQLKAGKAGTPAAVKGEIGKPQPNESLTKGGRFVLVASGSTSGKKGENDRLKTLTTEAEAAGLPTDRIAVIGSERLTEWVNQHPAIAARWANRPEGLWSLQDWPAQEHQAPLQASDSLASELAEYRQALDPTVPSNNPCLHLHLHGPPGAGKTRLALELCRQAPWADFVVYVQQARDSNVLSLLAQASSEEGVRFVVVADDTPAELLKPLRDALERSEGRIRLITLGSSHSPDPRRFRELAVEPLPTDSLSQLLGCWYPAMTADLVPLAVNLAAGNPRLTRLAADALNQNPALTTATLIEQPAIRELRAAIASHQKPKGRSDWSWPKAWDFTTYRSEKRQGFVGREWLFDEVSAWATNPESEQALLIGADYGVGKSAFMAELLDTGAAGLPVVAHHFCRADISDTLEAGRFVRSLASQLAQSLPAYRALLEADDAKELRETLDQANQKPLPAFDQAVLAPLRRIDAPATQLLLVIDALDEALDYRPEAGGSSRNTIVDLLAKEARNLPPWLRVLATSRRRPEVVESLRQGFFSIEEINAEEARNLADIHDYVVARCEQEPLAAILSRAGLSASETAEVLQAKSGGKFLYAVRVLNDLAGGALTLENRQTLNALPPGMDGFYNAAFERRFPEEASYAAVQPILALLCEQREPLGFQTLAAILGLSVRNVSASLQPLNDLLRLVPVPAAEASGRPDVLCSFDHLSLEQWLSEENQFFQPRAGRFGVDREVAAEQLRTWALAEVKANRAHTSPYLVRHLASHLRDDERAEVIAGQLRQFPWLQARLRLAGLNALLGDFDPPTDRQASLPPELQRLGRALRQAAHVLSYQEGWNGEEQLASQLLARLADDGALEGLRKQTAEWLQKAGGASPRAASLLASEALLRTLALGSNVNALVALHDGRLACGCGDGTIRLWDPASGSCIAIFQGHQYGVSALAVLGDGRLASGSWDQTIRLWDLASGACSTVFQGHQGEVSALAVLGNGRLASGAGDNTIRLWDLSSGSCIAVFDGHKNGVQSLAVLSDGRLASGSDDCTIRLWDPVNGECSAVFEGHELSVNALALLGDGRLASGSSDDTIRLWDLASGSCCAVLKGHQRQVYALAVLADGSLASGSRDRTIHIWDAASGFCSGVLLGHQLWVSALAVLDNGLLASGSVDGSIRLWDPASGSYSAVFQGHQGWVTALAALGDGRLASGSDDRTIRVWDLANGQCSAVFEGHESEVNALAVLVDGRLASGSRDRSIRLWDLASGGCSAVFQGHEDDVNALAVLGDGQLASGSDDYTIRLWDTVSGCCSTILKGHLSSVNTLAVLSDKRLASGSSDYTIRIWDLTSGGCCGIFEGCQASIRVLSKLRDGRIASGSGDLLTNDNKIRFWDAANGSCSAVFDTHPGVTGITFLKELGNGHLAYVSFDDYTIRLIDPRRPDGAPRVLFVADAAITALAWIPTHQLLVAGDASGRLHWLTMGPPKD